MSPRRSRWAAPLALALLALGLAYGAALAPGQVLLGADAYNLFLPLQHWLGQMVRAGALPAWYPLDGLGAPLAGSLVTMALDPLTLLASLLPAHEAVKATELGAYLAAAAGTFLLARALRMPTLPAAFAGLAFACTGYLASLSSNPEYLAGAARVPWALWASLRLRERGELRYASALGLALSSLLYVGDPEALLLATLASLALALRKDTWLQVGAAGAIALLVCAPLLLPALHTYGSSARAAALDPGEALAWSLHPVRLSELILGSAFLRADSATIARYGGQNGGFWALSVYAGAGVFALAVRGLLRPGARWPWVAAGAGALALSLALGSYGHLYAHVPLLTHFRYPEKLVPWASLVLALLAGRGLGGIGRGGWSWLIAAAGVVILASAIGSMGATGATALPLQALGMLAAVGLAARLLPGRIRTVAIAALALGELALADRGLVLHGPAAAWIPARSAVPEAQPGERICSDLEMAGFADAPGPEGWRAERTAQRLTFAEDLGGLFGLRSTTGVIPVATPELVLLCSVIDQCGTACARLQGARWQWVQPEAAKSLVAGGEYRLVRELTAPRAALLEDLRAIPYASVRPARLYENPLDTAARLHQGTLHAGEVALLARAEVPAEPSEWTGHGEATFERNRPDRIRIRARADAPAVLVVQEGFNRDWRARLDGSAAPLLRADFGLLGLALPAGLHEVELQYQPWGAPWTALAALLGLALAGALVARRG